MAATRNQNSLCRATTGAAAHFRRGRTIVSESRRMIGGPRLLVRANAYVAGGLTAAGTVSDFEMFEPQCQPSPSSRSKRSTRQVPSSPSLFVLTLRGHG